MQVCFDVRSKSQTDHSKLAQRQKKRHCSRLFQTFKKTKKDFCRSLVVYSKRICREGKRAQSSKQKMVKQHNIIMRNWEIKANKLPLYQEIMADMMVFCVVFFCFQVCFFFSCERLLCSSSGKRILEKRRREKEDATELIKWNVLFFFGQRTLPIFVTHLTSYLSWRCRTSVAKLNKASSPFRVCVYMCGMAIWMKGHTVVNTTDSLLFR